MIKITMANRKSTLAMALLTLLLAGGTAFAEQLDTINVSAEAEKEVGVKKTTAEEIKKQQINNSHDLVRYNTEVDVAEVGRYGNKGFAIRGVDGNRVAMNIDGVSLPEVEVNEIFAPYGYMYEGRFNPDVEMMGGVRITAGSDSLLSGSGAVGGSVSYSTKKPQDLIRDGKNLGGYLKVGYADKNSEWLTATGLAGKYDKFEFLINYSQRNGHELKNHDMRHADNARLDPWYIFPKEEMPYRDRTNSSIYPNALDFKRDSFLGKIYFNVNENHRVGLSGLYQKQKNLMNNDSANFLRGERIYGQNRRAHDIERMNGYGVEYQYTPNNSVWLDKLNLELNYNKILGLADTWIYDRTFTSWNSGILSQVKLYNREYRPTETETRQGVLSMQFQPVSLGRWGEHMFSITGRYTKQDYTSSAVSLQYDDFVKDNFIQYPFTDAKKDIYNITLTDKIYFNDRFNAMLGLRYDHYSYQPYIQGSLAGVTRTEYQQAQAICGNPGYSVTEWCSYINAGKELPKKKFHHLTWSGAFEYQIVPEKFTTRYKIGTGFLAPNVTQMFSNFQGLGARQLTNYNLKPETSLNNEIEFEYKPVNALTLTASGYITQYKNFIHTRYWNTETNGCTRGSGTCLQSVNLDKAKVYGFKFGAEANVSDMLDLAGQLKFTFNFHTAKDSAEIETDNDGKKIINTLAAVPTNFVLGADYISEDNSWELHAKLRFIERKKANETKTLAINRTQTGTTSTCPDWWNPSHGDCTYYGYGSSTPTYSYNEYVDTYNHIDKSKTVALIDVYGSKKFGKDKNWILNAGIYNLTNVKYIPWETLRRFSNTTVNDMIDKEGYGFNRYTAPGRNYAVSLTYEF